MHPEHQFRVQRAVTGPGWERPELLLRPAADAGVQCPHPRASLFRLLPGAEGDQVQRAQRADEAAPEVLVIAGVLDHATGDQWVRDLEQHGGATAQERRHRRVPQPPHNAVRAEVAISRPQTLEVRA